MSPGVGGRKTEEDAAWDKNEELRCWLRSSPQTLARELVAWKRAPSQLLMRSPLLRFQTPAAPREAVGFFGFGGSASCLAKGITRPTSDRSMLLGPTLSTVDSITLRLSN